LASYLFKNRIVYLGMSLVPSVTELILAEFLYLQYEDEEKPIYLYINSTGTTKVECFSCYFFHMTLCVHVFVFFPMPVFIYPECHVAPIEFFIVDFDMQSGLHL
jgi:hypothetical protein